MRAAARLRAMPLELPVLTALAFATRFWRLFDPNLRVWDEVYFQEYASRYLTGSYFFDVHPPLGKLLFALSAWVTRVPVDRFANAASVPELRLLSAFAGSLLIPTVWWLLRELGASRRVAAFGAAVLVLDNALLVQSRFVLTDILLLWFGIAAVAAFVTARRLGGRGRWIALGLAALLAGAAASTKWTGLTALGLIGAVWLVDAWRARPGWTRLVWEGALLVVVPAAVYLGSFAAHFALLPNDGPGVQAMSEDFAATRRGNPLYRPEAHISFAREVAELHREMMATNLGWSTLKHVAASKWYTWPISKHRIMLWKSTGETNGQVRRIDIQGNPVLWYGILVAIGVFVVAVARRRVTIGAHRDALLFLGAGYVMNFVPFAFIARPMYLYHYYFALVYSVAFAAMALGLLTGWQRDDNAPWRFPTRRSAAIYVGALAAVLLSFMYFAPLSYGTALSERAQAQRAWVLERQ
jgi:dolichyl-phosphate-mannose-protein mannosyltransferase